MNRAAIASLAALISSSALAGPLAPPVGPVAPTIGPEPRTPINATNTPGDAGSLFKITQPGSYYLIGDIAGVAAKHGIEIAASNVSLDLMGFNLMGIPGTLDGITVLAASISNVAVINGTVRGWGGVGLNFGTAFVDVTSIRDVRAVSNTGSGITTSGRSALTGCIASTNGANGFNTSSNATFQQCMASGNTLNGYSGGFSSVYTGCTSYQNSQAGFLMSALCTVDSCVAGFNGGSGISVNNGSLVTRCVALGNTMDGINCTFGALILDNNCDQNGNGGGNGAGIHATGSDNRIEGNNSTQADRGIDVDTAGNIIVRNTCASNATDWEIAANNVFGPIVDRRTPASAAVSGFTAASSLGTTDPNANFSY